MTAGAIAEKDRLRAGAIIPARRLRCSRIGSGLPDVEILFDAGNLFAFFIDDIGVKNRHHFTVFPSFRDS